MSRPPGERAGSAKPGQAVTFTELPRVLADVAPEPCRSWRKLVRKDCRADTPSDVEEPEVVEPEAGVGDWVAVVEAVVEVAVEVAAVVEGPVVAALAVVPPRSEINLLKSDTRA